MIVPNRTGSSTAYRYGFNGKEKDDEIKGIGNSYDFGARMYDSRIGRWFAIDPQDEKYPDWSPYNYSLNNPLFYVDPDGESPISFFIKLVAKAGLKKSAKEFVEVQVKKRLKAYMSKKWAQQLGKDALDFVDKATTDHWWEYVIEAIPVAGDAYGAGKLGKQGYTVWKGLEKFKKVAELGERAAKVSWKKLGSNLNLKGKGSNKLIDFINDVNKNIGEKLNDNTLAGAIKEKFGLNSGFKPDGTPFKHLNSANDRLRGLDNKIRDLSEDIFKNDSFGGDSLDSAKKILKNLESQRDKIKEALKSADTAVVKMGKIE